MPDHIKHDVLIVGGGLAGLRAAVSVHDAGTNVAVMSKVFPIRSHSGAAQGGVNAALGNHPDGGDDTWERHAFDTIKGSDYLADQPRAEILAQEAPARVIEMEHWGAYFSRFEDGRIAQRPFGGAGFPRTCFAADRTGHHLLHTLWQQCQKRGITFYHEWQLTDIAVDAGRVTGVVALHVPTGELKSFRSNAVVLAGGGHGRIFSKTTNAYINTGSATAAAYRAGARLEDMEFVQFHPTTLYGTNILISEGVRGEGGLLYNSEGQRFMGDYAPSVMELAPRDIVARAIRTEVNEGRGFEGEHVHLDIRHLGADVIKSRLPGIRQIAMDFAGVDPIDTPIPVQPGQHYSMGGVSSDENGRTDIEGLLAVGECSCVSVHGANRLGGNSLLETLVFGKRAGDMAVSLSSMDGGTRALDDAVARRGRLLDGLAGRDGGERQAAIRREMQDVMTDHVGVYREEAGLERAVTALLELRDRYRAVGLDSSSRRLNYDLVDTLELGGMLDLALMTAMGALERTECRGSHWRVDHLGRDDENWMKHTLATLGADGLPVIDYADVIITSYEPMERKYLMKPTTFKFAIERRDPESSGERRVQEYEVEVAEGTTVLEALHRIQADIDGTLAFRYACRGAVCGSCAMLINGEVGLACRTQVHGLETEVITIGPLPHLPVLKDLVVDMEPFFGKDIAVQPWLQPGDPDPEGERIVLATEWGEAEPYTNCILCASCHGVCPVPERDPSYLGPAALGKHYRFLSDPRDAADEERLGLVDGEHGVHGCDTVWRCVRVCPKGVPPTKGILATRERLSTGGDS